MPRAKTTATRPPKPQVTGPASQHAAHRGTSQVRGRSHAQSRKAAFRHPHVDTVTRSVNRANQLARLHHARGGVRSRDDALSTYFAFVGWVTA